MEIVQAYLPCKIVTALCQRGRASANTWTAFVLSVKMEFLEIARNGVKSLQEKVQDRVFLKTQGNDSVRE